MSDCLLDFIFSGVYRCEIETCANLSHSTKCLSVAKLALSDTNDVMPKIGKKSASLRSLIRRSNQLSYAAAFIVRKLEAKALSNFRVTTKKLGGRQIFTLLVQIKIKEIKCTGCPEKNFAQIYLVSDFKIQRLIKGYCFLI